MSDTSNIDDLAQLVTDPLAAKLLAAFRKVADNPDGSSTDQVTELREVMEASLQENPDAAP